MSGLNAGIGRHLGRKIAGLALYEFTVYRYTPSDPQSLSNSAVVALYVDTSGILWIGTADGLTRFDVATELFTIYRHAPNDAHSLSDNIVRIIYQDAAGTFWIGAENGGLNQFDPETGRYEDSIGVLWVGTLGGLNKIRQRAVAVGQEDARYRPSAVQLEQLARDFEEDQIRTFLARSPGGDL